MKPIQNAKMLKNSIGYYIIHNGPCKVKDIFKALWCYMGADMILSERSITSTLRKMDKFTEKDGLWSYLG
jgi:hypothetical protein